MTILRKTKRSDTQRKKVIGAYLPQPLIDYMTLYTLAYGKSNGALIEKLLEEWKKITKFSDATFFKAIAARALKEFEVQRKINRELNFETFLPVLKEELREKKVCDEHIKEIFKILENAKKEK